MLQDGRFEDTARRLVLFERLAWKKFPVVDSIVQSSCVSEDSGHSVDDFD